MRLEIRFFIVLLDIPADLVAELIARVPTANLEDRQNSALTLGVLAAAALSRPEQVLLSGYVVGPPRHDERVSVDGVTILRTPIRALGGWGVEPAGEERMVSGGPGGVLGGRRRRRIVLMRSFRSLKRA